MALTHAWHAAEAVPLFVTSLFFKNAAMELFNWLEDNHLMREDWSTAIMEHGLKFVKQVILELKRPEQLVDN